MTWKVGSRVQDKKGFTGTVSAQWDDEVEVTWDVSGCASDLKEGAIEPLIEGQDDPARQSALHKQVFATE